MTDLTLKVGDGGYWSLSGELTFSLLSHKYGELSRRFPVSGQWTIDCGQLMRIDSSGVAFLLACIRRAKAHQITLRIVSAHEQLSTIIALQGVQEIITPFLEKKA